MKRTINYLIATLLLLLGAVNVYSAGEKDNGKSSTSPYSGMNAKYVFLFIGDGVALPQISAAEAYLSAEDGKMANMKKLIMSQFPAQGMTTTYSSNALITDSAAAGTAIATGNKTESGVISMDPSKTVSYKTLAEMAKEAGMKVGIVSSVNLDHATPATFYAHNSSRNNYYEINMAMANSNFDYFGGGMVRIDKTPEGQKNAHEVMAENGWIIASTREEMSKIIKADSTVYAYNQGFAGNALDYVLDQDSDDVTISEFTKKGIELLENDKGFFMMVEGGKIDWACHANDAAASITNTIAFDKAIGEALAFYDKHPQDTLIIVTGDHETGGLTLGFAGTEYSSAFNLIGNQKMSFEGFDKFVLEPFKKVNGKNGKLEQILPSIEKEFGLTDFSDFEMSQLSDAFQQSMMAKDERVKNDQSYLLYGGYEPLTMTLTHILNQRSGLAWTSYSHTGVPVPTFAKGAGEKAFNGYYDNTDLFVKISGILGF
jgi:alkaline phosphatase